ncbi:MAG: hypothetical protein JWP06_180 [Candidatus Saccharibacteria bacterium]|nr:hypothetical protein [Candidatus Saccharibacteria bacterium]
MTIASLLAFIGIGLGGAGTLIYGAHTWQRKNKPRVASWLAWAVTNTVFAWLAYSHEAYWAAAFSASAATLNYSVLIICVVRRRGSFQGIDAVCLAAVAVCLLLVTTSANDLTLAWVSVVANLIATAPTFHNAWRHARRETWHLFGANALANLLGVLCAGGFDDFAKIAGPLVGMSANIALTSIILWRRWEIQYHTISATAALHIANTVSEM